MAGLYSFDYSSLVLYLCNNSRKTAEERQSVGKKKMRLLIDYLTKPFALEDYYDKSEGIDSLLIKIKKALGDGPIEEETIKGG